MAYYDKEKKESIPVKDGFTFMVLDSLSTVKGYNKKAKSGIYANEVRSTKKEPFHVKLFDGTDIAQGLWQDIKEKVSYNKGKFASSVYIAYKDGDDLKMGNITFTGCSLGPWIDFYKENRDAANSKAVSIRKGEVDTSGDVEFTPPVFSVKDITEETNEQAKELDRQLQTYLSSRSTAAPEPEEELQEPRGNPDAQPEGDEIPF